MRENPRIADLVPFRGDKQVVVEWSNFSNPFCFVMKRLFHWQFPIDDFWLDGISHAMLEDITVDDIRDLKHVGQKRFDNTLDELRHIFRTLDDELEKREISLAISPVPYKYEGLIEEKTEEEAIVDPVDSATNIEELRLAILNYFDLYKPIDERAREMIIARNLAFGNQHETLDSLGEKFGVTRERVRQIVTKYEDLVLSSPRETNQLLEKVLDLANHSENHIEFAILMIENGLTDQEDFSIVNAVALCEILQIGDLADSFLGVYERWEQNHAKLDEQTKKVNRYRSKVGLIDLEFMSNDLQLDVEKSQLLVSRAYPRSLFDGKYALARTNKLDTTFENVLHKQLLVTDQVNCEELVEGIRRHAQHRNTELPGENFELVGLVHLVAGNPPRLEVLESNTLEKVELSETDRWFIERFENREKKILHRSELLQMALEEGRNTATVGVYTLFNPLLRNCGNSVYTLIGNSPDSEDVRIHAEIVRKNVSDSQIEYSFIEQNIELKILPNINALGGVIFPPKELHQLVNGVTFVPKCDCNGLASKQKIQFSVSNFWMGFSSIFKHAIEAHGWAIKSSITIELKFDSFQALLISESI